MGKAQCLWARRHSERLKVILGGKCKRCGVKKKRPLHFDVILPVNNDHHRKLSWDQRIRFYYKQHAAGNLQLLCLVCNGKKGGGQDKAYYAQRAIDQQLEAEGQALASMVTDDSVPF